LEECPEEIGQKEAGAIHTLIRIGISVISTDSFIGNPEESSSHMSQEARLLIKVIGSTNVWEEFISQKILYRHIACRFTGPDIQMLLILKSTEHPVANTNPSNFPSEG
jgi:hypothetical protein